MSGGEVTLKGDEFLVHDATQLGTDIMYAGYHLQNMPLTATIAADSAQLNVNAS